ncbi:polyphosphate:AMP phosphotransferase [Desnuesiella massiliensis]|uniref:polyphosphate:AMP phosphotransferase n=1 Tax=Desnuesiella massiliensis TaxID=1650662 RepID=UPI0006E309F6|nr:polyphosphate:AMP phosphotransferase [Desnuesiella massiliensis]
MLRNIGLSNDIDKEIYKEHMGLYSKKLVSLQRELIKLNIPVIIVFEGWGASGKGTFINELILPLDPRGFNVYTTNRLTEEELFRPFLWRFWSRTPEKGRISIFDKSWYKKVMVDRVDENIEGAVLKNYFEDINNFEKVLSDDGNIIIKFFLHISKKEQRKRFKELENNPSTAWRVTEADWKHNLQYEKYVEAVEDMIKHTDKSYAPWHIIPSEHKKCALCNIFSKLIQALEAEINRVKSNGVNKKVLPKDENSKDADDYDKVLKNIDLNKALSKEEYKGKLKGLQGRMRDIEHEIYRRRIPVVIVYEGWDAAGKGGNIKRIVRLMDPRGYEVIPISAPSNEEKDHHYLWRFWKRMPKAGHVAIFDRSWYGRVLVERIEGFCTEDEWKRAYEEINSMEKQLSNFGVVIIKFWIHIDKETQLERFIERQNTEEKQWKITEEDWRNREKWDQYERALSEMFYKTNTEYAPWTIVESKNKYYARIKTLETVICNIEKALKVFSGLHL